jgi:hypothetical protein
MSDADQLSEDELRGSKLARNQSLFREINEQIRRLALRQDFAELELLCECADGQCADLLSVPVDTYELIRTHPDRFLICRGHQVPEIERTVGRFNGYLVVETVGLAGEVATQLDPRARPAARRDGA